MNVFGKCVHVHENVCVGVLYVHVNSSMAWELCGVDICSGCCSSTWCQASGVACFANLTHSQHVLYCRLLALHKRAMTHTLPLCLYISIARSPSTTFHQASEQALIAIVSQSSSLFHALLRGPSVFFIDVCFVCIKKYFERGTNSLRDAKFVSAVTLKSQIIVHNPGVTLIY